MNTQMLMDGDRPYLPQEIIRKILERLPVKSLIRIRCVCKDWRNLIKSPSFIADHLHHSTHHQNPSLLLYTHNKLYDPLDLLLMDYEMHVREVHDSRWIGALRDFNIIGSSNGLLCAVFNKYHSSVSWFPPYSLLLWNLATGESRQIPKTRTSKFPSWECHGFGFSPIVNDYKIVQTYNVHYEEIGAVEVYSLSTGSWKEIELGCLEGVYLVDDSRTVTANGCIFWDGAKLVEEEGKDDNDVIVSFDIATEVFTLIKRPPLSNISKFVLTVYEDKVAVLSLSMIGDLPDYSYSLIDLWVLEDSIGPSTERWTKKFTSHPCPSTLDIPETIWGNEIVVRYNESDDHEMENDEEKDSLYLINIVTNQIKMFTMSGFGIVFNYVESLVPAGNI